MEANVLLLKTINELKMLASRLCVVICLFFYSLYRVTVKNN